MMMRHVFETHQPSNPVEELLKAAATGDVQTVDEVTAHCMDSNIAITVPDNQARCGDTITFIITGALPAHKPVISKVVNSCLTH